MMMAFLSLMVVSSLLFLLYYLKRNTVTLSHRVLLSLPLGLGCGVLFRYTRPTHWLMADIQNILTLIGDGYLSLLKMIVIPLVFTSIIHAILQLGKNNERLIKKMSFLTCGILLAMTSLASFIALMIGKFFVVGEGLKIPSTILNPKHTYTGLTNALLGMIPSNPMASMTESNTIAVVIFSALLGISARMLDQKDQEKFEFFKNMIATLFAIVKKLAQWVLELTPYGILALISLLVYTQGIVLLKEMLNFIAAMYVAMLLVMMMHVMLLMCFGYRPWDYFKKAFTPLLIAFTTRSSFGTLSSMESTLTDQFKTDSGIASFVPSIGATIGMNACAGVFPAMLVIMALNITHQPLTWSFVALVMIINAIASIGISGIPGTAYIAATVTLTSLQLPYAIVALVQGIDPIVDMGRTATNVNGTLTTALLVDRLMSDEAKNLVLIETTEGVRN